MAQVVEFYETMEGMIIKEGPIGFLKELWQIIVSGYFYVRSDNDYYLVELNHFPYVDIHYARVPLP